MTNREEDRLPTALSFLPGGREEWYSQGAGKSGKLSGNHREECSGNYRDRRREVVSSNHRGRREDCCGVVITGRGVISGNHRVEESSGDHREEENPEERRS